MRWRDGDGPGEPDIWDAVDEGKDHAKEPPELTLAPLSLSKGTE